MNKLLALVLVLFSTLTWADNRSWSDEEKAWGYTALALTVADWAQTRDLTRRYSEGYYERNPVLGKYPSQGRVDTHFVISGLLTYLMIKPIPTANTIGNPYLLINPTTSIIFSSLII